MNQEEVRETVLLTDGVVPIEQPIDLTREETVSCGGGGGENNVERNVCNNR